MHTILVVDDTALARESLAKLLGYEGFRVMKAGNGKEAWAMMYHDRPDLVLLDLMMPEMDGVTFLSMVRGSPLWRDLRVIVLTGTNDRDGLISRVWKLGVSDVIPKAGFGVGDLFDTIRRHLPPQAPPTASNHARSYPSTLRGLAAGEAEPSRARGERQAHPASVGATISAAGGGGGSDSMTDQTVRRERENDRELVI